MEDEVVELPEKLEVSCKVLERWGRVKGGEFDDRVTQFDLHLMRVGKKMSKIYPTNVYKLNKVSVSGIRKLIRKLERFDQFLTSNYCIVRTKNLTLVLQDKTEKEQH